MNDTNKPTDLLPTDPFTSAPPETKIDPAKLTKLFETVMSDKSEEERTRLMTLMPDNTAGQESDIIEQFESLAVRLYGKHEDALKSGIVLDSTPAGSHVDYSLPSNAGAVAKMLSSKHMQVDPNLKKPKQMIAIIENRKTRRRKAAQQQRQQTKLRMAAEQRRQKKR